MDPDGRASRRVWAPWGALLVVQLLFGGLPVVSKFAIAEVSPQAVVLCRGFAAAAVFALLAFFRGKSLSAQGRPSAKSPLGMRTHLALMGLAAVGVSLNQTALFYGLQHTTSAAGAILVPMISVFALLLSLLLGREPFAWNKLANIVLGMAGTVLLFAPELHKTFSADVLSGNALCLLSTFLYASYLAAAPPVVAQVGSLEFSRLVFLYASALNIIVFVVLSGIPDAGVFALVVEALPRLSGVFWAALAYVLLGATVVTYLLNAYALEKLPPGVVGGVVCVQTVIGVALSNLLLAEPFPPEHALAMALVVAGVLCLWIPTGASKARSVE